MQFRKGVAVFSSDDKKLGTLLGVVMDPKTTEASHLVVHKGFLFTEDKVVPMNLVGTVMEDRIVLKDARENLDELPRYEETHYIPIDQAGEEVELMYWNPPIEMYWGRVNNLPVFPESPFVRKVEKNIPEGTVGLMEGAQVVASDGETVGEIESMFADPLSNRITHIVLASGGIVWKQWRIIPVHWLKDVGETDVHLSVDSKFVERLREYHPQS
jgi:sporulation protein YlmC with PRC-barrel domain